MALKVDLLTKEELDYEIRLRGVEVSPSLKVIDIRKKLRQLISLDVNSNYLNLSGKVAFKEEWDKIKLETQLLGTRLEESIEQGLTLDIVRCETKINHWQRRLTNLSKLFKIEEKDIAKHVEDRNSILSELLLKIKNLKIDKETSDNLVRKLSDSNLEIEGELEEAGKPELRQPVNGRAKDTQPCRAKVPRTTQLITDRTCNKHPTTTITVYLVRPIAANLRWERFKQTCRNRSVVSAGRETTFCYNSELRSERNERADGKPLHIPFVQESSIHQITESEDTIIVGFWKKVMSRTIYISADDIKLKRFRISDAVCLRIESKVQLVFVTPYRMGVNYVNQPYMYTQDGPEPAHKLVNCVNQPYMCTQDGPDPAHKL
ncbi:hypothetical protein J6590_031219 [Homalodisca vitripennis]|nr:hypothetical protein J6590_031219 [Homalodisca vitripennis]